MKWYYQDKELQVVGPISESSLIDLRAAGVLADDTQVCREGTEDWIPYATAMASEKPGKPPAPPGFNFNCPHCNQHIAAETSDAGLSTQCPACGGEIQVPGSSEQPPSGHIGYKGRRSKRVFIAGAVTVILLVTAAIVAFAIVRSGEAAGSESGEPRSTSAGSLPPISKPTPSDFSLILAGEFVMGDTFDEMEDTPPHTVNLSAFYMAKHEVTQGLWSKVRAWALENGYHDLPEGEGETDSHPAYRLNWFDAIKWCNAKSEMDGLQPCYMLLGKVYRKGVPVYKLEVEGGHLVKAWSRELVCDFSANGYRLPTEAEWEKAARGGKEGQRFPWGDTISHWHANYTAYYNSYPYQEMITFDQAHDENLSPARQGAYQKLWRSGSSAAMNPYNKSDASYRHDKAGSIPPFHVPVGSFPPNGYGLFDMAGNASEWCWDSMSGDYYSESPELNPVGPSRLVYDPSGSGLVYGQRSRVHRGGSGMTSAPACRLANRNFDEEKRTEHGFRLVRR